MSAIRVVTFPVMIKSMYMIPRSSIGVMNEI